MELNLQQFKDLENGAFWNHESLIKGHICKTFPTKKVNFMKGELNSRKGLVKVLHRSPLLILIAPFPRSLNYV